ncbi:phosphatase PAP2 family protein [Rhodococcus sp. TAF43]|uniref:phosphatase PAP2 family protein n=1 Tax=Rhodococcus sp. TAF43 TaxID=3237483 RepID=UPI003F97D44D
MDTVGPPPLIADSATLVVGAFLIVLGAALQKRWLDGAVAIVIVGAASVTTQLVKEVLPRPDLVGAGSGLTEVSFPSGHVTITVALAIGAYLVAPAWAQSWVAALGAVWVSTVAGAVQALYWHRPIDVVGATLLTGTCALSIVVLARRSAPRSLRPIFAPAALPTLLPAALAALLAASREDSWARPLVFSVAAWLSAVVLWLTLQALAAPKTQSLDPAGPSAVGGARIPHRRSLYTPHSPRTSRTRGSSGRLPRPSTR